MVKDNHSKYEREKNEQHKINVKSFHIAVIRNFICERVLVKNTVYKKAASYRWWMTTIANMKQKKIKKHKTNVVSLYCGNEKRYLRKSSR